MYLYMYASVVVLQREEQISGCQVVKKFVFSNHGNKLNKVA